MTYELHGKKITSPAAFKNYHVLVSLLFETALPFLKNKLHNKGSKLVNLLISFGELSIFTFQFRYLVQANFKFFKPYFQFFGIIVRAQNQFEMN